MTYETVLGTGTTSAWAGSRAPSSVSEWLTRAEEVAAILGLDAVERDRANAAPHIEVQLLKDSGLVALLGPVEFGGGGQTWDTANKLVYNGSKSFSTGGRVSDLTVLEGILEGTDTHIFAIVPTDAPGLDFAGDNKDAATEEFYILAGYGDLQSKLWADEALIDQVDAEISAILHAERSALTERPAVSSPCASPQPRCASSRTASRRPRRSSS